MLKSINEDALKAAEAILYPPKLYHFDSLAKGIWGGFEAVTDADVQFFPQARISRHPRCVQSRGDKRNIRGDAVSDGREKPRLPGHSV